MTTKEIDNFNRLCAEFWNEDMNHVFSFLEDEDLKFHTDWNWIQEIVAKIQLLDIVHEYTRHYDNVYKEWVCTFSPSYKTHDFGLIEGKSKVSEKEAVLEAINQFLIWYNENKIN